MDGFEDVTHLIRSHDYSVYILKHRRCIVYVGQTRRLLERMRQHRASKVFDQVLVKWEGSLESALELEGSLIRQHRPKYNKIVPSMGYKPAFEVDLSKFGLDLTEIASRSKPPKPSRIKRVRPSLPPWLG